MKKSEGILDHSPVSEMLAVVIVMMMVMMMMDAIISDFSAHLS